MSDYVSVPGIIGTDGKVPLYNPEGLFKMWASPEIFMGAEAEGRYVPNVNDLVFNPTTRALYLVTAVDQTTFIATLKRTSMDEVSGEFTDGDLLVGVGPGTRADTYRVMVDKSTIPYTCAVKATLYYPGDTVSYIKLFSGFVPDGDSNCISLLYDASNNLLGNQIPVVASNTDGKVRCIPPFATRENLVDNQYCVVVAYNDAGVVVSKDQVIVEETAFIHSYNRTVKYITGIRLEAPFISTVDNSLIKLPMNVPVGSLNLVGVVEYSDGDTARYPVDGTKFEIYGMDNFLSTVPSEELSLTLKYNLADTEVNYGSTIVNGERFRTRDYKAIVSEFDGSYTLRLYGYPMWIDAINGYRMEYFLYNLERNRHTRVTSLIRLADNAAGFSPLLYGTAQALNVAVNLREVDASYTSYRHAQTLTVTLSKPGTDPGVNWSVMHSPNQSPQYGLSNELSYEFVNENFKRLNLAMGKTTLDAWLDMLFTRARPLINQYAETSVPAPTHFNLVVGSTSTEYLIGQWNEVVIAGSGLYNGATVYFEFFKRTASADLYLACGAAVAKQQS